MANTYWHGAKTSFVGVVPKTTTLQFLHREFTAELSLALAAGTELGIGKYRYKISYANSLGESKPSFASTELKTKTKQQRISISNIPLGPSGTQSRKLYRTEVDGKVYKYLATIGDNTTTTYSDQTADSTLGGNLSDPIPGENRAIEVRHGLGANIIISYRKNEYLRTWQLSSKIFVSAWIKDLEGAGLYLCIQRGGADSPLPGYPSYYIIREASDWKLKKGNFPAYTPAATTLLSLVPSLSLTDGYYNFGLAVETRNSTVFLALYETKILTPESFYDYKEMPDMRYEDASSPYLSSVGAGIVSYSASGNVSHIFDHILHTENFEIR